MTCIKKWEEGTGYPPQPRPGPAICTTFRELYHEELDITLPGIAPVRYI